MTSNLLKDVEVIDWMREAWARRLGRILRMDAAFPLRMAKGNDFETGLDGVEAGLRVEWAVGLMSGVGRPQSGATRQGGARRVLDGPGHLVRARPSYGVWGWKSSGLVMPRPLCPVATWR